MSGYSRSCSRADSSILLVAQCAAALSMMPASAPSCWAQGVTAASYNEFAIWVSPSGGILHVRFAPKADKWDDIALCPLRAIGDICNATNSTLYSITSSASEEERWPIETIALAA